MNVSNSSFLLYGKYSISINSIIFNFFLSKTIVKKIEKEKFGRNEEEEGKLVGKNGSLNDMKEFFTLYSQAYPNTINSKNQNKNLEFDPDDFEPEEAKIRQIHEDV
jgi:hypothetical protein